MSALGSRKCVGGGGLAWSKGRKEEEARVDGHHIYTASSRMVTIYCQCTHICMCICIYTPTLLGHHILPVYTHTYTPTLYGHCILPPRAVYTYPEQNTHILHGHHIRVVSPYIQYGYCLQKHQLVTNKQSRTQCHHERSLHAALDELCKTYKAVEMASVC